MNLNKLVEVWLGNTDLRQRFQEWAVKDYFSKAELQKVEDLDDTTYEDKLDIINKASEGDKTCIMYLIVKNHRLLGSHFVKTILPFAADKNEAFDNFMSTIVEILFDTDSSVFQNFKPHRDTDPITYFGSYLLYYVQSAYFDQRKKELRKGVTGNVTKDGEENLRRASNFEGIPEVESEEVSDRIDMEASKEVFNTVLKRLDPKLKETVAKALSNYKTFSASKVADALGISEITVKNHLKKFGEILIEEGLDLEDFMKYAKIEGFDTVLEDNRIEKTEDKKPEVSKAPSVKIDPETMTATDIVLAFLKNNEKGSKATYSDFVKSDLRFDALGKVNMRNFNSAKARLKAAGQI